MRMSLKKIRQTILSRSDCEQIAPNKPKEQRRRCTKVRALMVLAVTSVWIPSTPVVYAQENATKTTPETVPYRRLQKNQTITYTGNEAVEADVSTHSIAVTSGFSGTKIIIFGTVTRPLKIAPDPSVYDVIVAVEGNPEPLIARRKSRVLGLWVNIGSLKFETAPSYYTVASTRPIEEIADRSILARHRIGFKNLAMQTQRNALASRSIGEIADYKDAVIRLKREVKLYQKQDRGVHFIGKSLFRSSFELPANVPVGPLRANIFLFREGKLLARFTSQVQLRREGLQRLLYDLAFNYPFFYGLLAVLFAAIAGVSASAVFGRKQH